MKKKWLSILLCIAMVTSLFSNSTIAFLTDTDSDVNVMTVGKVEIEQIEQQRDAANNLVDFVQKKQLFPAHYTEAELPLEGYIAGHEGEPAWQIYAANDSVLDKFITVKNTGKSDAYVRTILAFERSEHELGRQYIHLNHNVITDVVEWEWVAEKVNLGGEIYDVAVATYLKPLSKGEVTVPSLKQLYMDKQADNEYYAAFGDRYEIKVLSQAVQAAGFDNAETALNEAFGVLDAASLTELLGGLKYEEEAVVTVSSEDELKTAIKNIQNDPSLAGTVIQLSSDIQLEETLVIPAEVTAVLDLDAYTLTVQPAASGRLFGMRSANADSVFDTIGNALRNFGQLILRGKKSAAEEPNACGIENSGKLVIESGYFKNAQTNGYALWNKDGGEVTISGSALIESESQEIAAVQSQGEVTVTGGTILGSVGALNVLAGTADIQGGLLKIVNEVTGIVLNITEGAQKVTISGGELDAGNDENTSGSVTVNSGVSAGKLEVSGGTFSEESNITEEHKKPASGETTVVLIQNEADLRNLFANGGTGKLMVDITVSEKLSVPAGKTVKLQMNDKCISSAATQMDVLIDNAGTLTLESETVRGYTLCDSGAYLTSLVTNAATGIFTAKNLVAVNESGKLIDNQGGQVTIEGGSWDAWAGGSSTGTVYAFNSNGGSITINNITTEATQNKGLFHASNNAEITVNGGNFRTRENSEPAYIAVALDNSRVVLKNGTYKWKGNSFAEVVQGNVSNENCTVTFFAAEPTDPLPTLSVTASAVPEAENGVITVTEGENVTIDVYADCSDKNVKLSYKYFLNGEQLDLPYSTTSYTFVPTLEQNGAEFSVVVTPNKAVEPSTPTHYEYVLNVQAKTVESVEENFTWELMLNGLSGKKPIDLGRNNYLNQNFFNQYAIEDLTITTAAGKGISDLTVKYTPMPLLAFAVNEQADGEIITVTVVSKDGNTYIANYQIKLMRVVRKEAAINTESGAVMTKKSDGDYEITVKEGTSLTVTANYELLTGGTPDMTYEWGFQANGLDLGGQTGPSNSYTFTVGEQHNNTTLEVSVENNQNPAEWDSIGFELSVEPADEPAVPTLSMTVETVPAAVDGKITVTEGEAVTITAKPECSDPSIDIGFLWLLESFGDTYSCETLDCTTGTYTFTATQEHNGKTISVLATVPKDLDPKPENIGPTGYGFELVVVQEITTYEQLKELFKKGGSGKIAEQNLEIGIDETLVVEKGITVKLDTNGGGICNGKSMDNLIVNHGKLIITSDVMNGGRYQTLGNSENGVLGCLVENTGILEMTGRIFTANTTGQMLKNIGGTVYLDGFFWSCEVAGSYMDEEYIFENTAGGTMNINNVLVIEVRGGRGGYYCSGEGSVITVANGAADGQSPRLTYLAKAENGGSIRFVNGGTHEWMSSKVTEATSGNVEISEDVTIDFTVSQPYGEAEVRTQTEGAIVNSAMPSILYAYPHNKNEQDTQDFIRKYFWKNDSGREMTAEEKAKAYTLTVEADKSLFEIDTTELNFYRAKGAPVIYVKPTSKDAEGKSIKIIMSENKEGEMLHVMEYVIDKPKAECTQLEILCNGGKLTPKFIEGKGNTVTVPAGSDITISLDYEGIGQTFNETYSWIMDAEGQTGNTLKLTSVTKNMMLGCEVSNGENKIQMVFFNIVVNQ